MCGISGVVIVKDSAVSFLDRINESTEILGKRGPDGNGVYRHNNVALGHARLSIIDVTEKAAQPFTDESGRYTIVFNGEIYNYKDLHANLVKLGDCFTSNSDTEVLLKLFIREGVSCLDKLNGFFAFAIYDKEKDVLIIGRDRMGIKPLFLYTDDEKIIFASEMKSLMAFGIPRELDKTSLFSYLQLNYIPAPNTILRNVRKMVAGSYIRIERGVVKEEKKYYSINMTDASDDNISYDNAKKKLRELISDSVEKRLMSDVPLGAFLSGGVDSSVIVAMASKFHSNLKTFSIGFKDEPFFDETYYAELVASKYKTEHTTFKLSNDDLFGVLFDVLDYIDEPFADSSALAVYILSHLTRKHVTVALSGDGADEMFSGYNKHSAEYNARNTDWKSSAVKAVHPMLRYLPQSRNSVFSNKIRQLNRYAEGIALPYDERYWRWCSFMNEIQAGSLMKENLFEEEYLHRKKEILNAIKKEKGINDVLYTDMHLVLQNDMLVKVDMMSMANSLEVRVPFLDHRVVDFAFSLPSEYKIDKTGRKKILKDAFSEFLPVEIYKRPKHGFEVPLLKWFSTELKSLIFDDLLSEEFIIEQQIFSVNSIRELKNKLTSANPGESVSSVWALVVFQYWWKKYMK